MDNIQLVNQLCTFLAHVFSKCLKFSPASAVFYKFGITLTVTVLVGTTAGTARAPPLRYEAKSNSCSYKLCAVLF